MEQKKRQNAPKESDEELPFRVRLPGFLVEEEIGLGDIIKRATATVGIKPCGGCEQRAAALNRRFTFSAWRPKE